MQPNFYITLRFVCVFCFLLEKIFLLIKSLFHATIQTTFFIAAFNRNYNYGEVSKELKVDLLNHPEYIEQNATLSFQVAIWRWMTPIMEHLPSAHDVFTSYWKPTKNDSLAKQVSGFGATINVLYGDLVCSQGDNEFVNNIISHYLYYLDLMGVGREEAGPHEVLSCAEQVAFNPTTSSSP